MRKSCTRRKRVSRLAIGASSRDSSLVSRFARWGPRFARGWYSNFLLQRNLFRTHLKQKIKQRDTFIKNPVYSTYTLK